MLGMWIPGKQCRLVLEGTAALLIGLPHWIPSPDCLTIWLYGGFR